MEKYCRGAEQGAERAILLTGKGKVKMKSRTKSAISREAIAAVVGRHFPIGTQKKRSCS